MVKPGSEAEPAQAPKKPYQKPKLQKLETIRELTQGGRSSGADVPGRKKAGT